MLVFFANFEILDELESSQNTLEMLLGLDFVLVLPVEDLVLALLIQHVSLLVSLHSVLRVGRRIQDRVVILIIMGIQLKVHTFVRVVFFKFLYKDHETFETNSA